MSRARDIMTGSLITCSPDMSAAEAARLMRDRNTGDVLITDEGKLLGIVTDRDISVRVAARSVNPEEVPVRNIMSKHVVTGQPHWDLDKITKTMGKHQIRRLPIVDNGMLTGIISVGDLALRNKKSDDLLQSLRHISEPGRLHRKHSKGSSRALALLGLGLVAGAVIALSMSPKPLSELVDDMKDSRLAEMLDDFKNSDWVDQVSDLVKQGRDRISELVNA